MRLPLIVVAAVLLLIVFICALNHISRRLHDMRELARLRPRPGVEPREHAVVLGASWTGMLTAAVLAPYFSRITVLERDSAAALDAAGQPRKGVPQGHQSHVIVRYAIEFVNALVPSFETTLMSAGGHVGGDMGTDFGWFHRGRWRRRQKLGLPMWFASRPLIEWALRQSVCRLHPHVAIVADSRVTGLLEGPVGRSLRAVEITRQGVETSIEADFFADCTGKHSRSAVWLQACGWAIAPQERVDAATFYATCRLARRPAAPAHWAMTWHGGPGPRPGQFAGAVTVENDAVSVWGVQTGNPMDTDPQRFAKFFANMGTAELAAHVSESPSPSAPIQAFGAGPASRRSFCRMPDNFVVLGDAACTTNPVFGLGLSLAASTVACLAAALERRSQPGRPVDLGGLGTAVARRVHWRTLGPWLLTTCEEYRLPHTRGPHKDRWLTHLLQWYVNHAFYVAHEDPRVDARVLRVVGLVAHPLRVFAPYLMYRVVHHALQKSSALHTLVPR